MQALFVGIHMAHLGSTSLFGLYLAMGGVLAVSQGQCMLGRGVVTYTPPPPITYWQHRVVFGWKP